jgi:diguanylate cyclase (GGDEF)-like protein/PAS domain S-box-containing protein
MVLNIYQIISAPCLLPTDKREIYFYRRHFTYSNLYMELKQVAAFNIIEYMTDGFVAFDHNWRYAYVNAHAANLFGTTPQALLGRKYLECFPEAEGTRFHLAYQKVMAEKLALHIEEYFPPWKRWFENHIYPIPDGIAIFFHEITERKNDQKRLAESIVQLDEAQHLARLGSWKWVAQTGKLRCSEGLYRIFGLDRSSPIEDFFSLMSHVMPEDQPQLVQVRNQAIGRREPWEMEYRITRPDGRQSFIREKGKVILNPEGDLRGLLGYAQDISSAKQAETDLHRQQRLMALIVDALPINIYIKDKEGRYLLFNEESARVTGISKRDAIGKTDFDLFPEKLAELIRKEDRKVMETGEATSLETTIPVHGQQRHMLAGRTRLQLEGEEASLLGFAIDINERKESELRSQYLGSHDALTGLPNRSLLEDRLGHAIAHAHRSMRLVAVLFLDLDRFKVINDSLGHKSGDELLCILADRMSQSMREGDTLARLGGDEFVILLEGLESESQAAFIAEDLLSRIAQTLTLEMQAVTPSASMGIGIYPKDGQDAAMLLKNADIAMYHAKEAGGNCLRFFDEEMNAQAVRRMLIESSLRKALEPGSEELSLHYQPIIELASGCLVGMEALARWNCQDQSISSPDNFIPVAEETGLIIPLSEKLLRLACRQFRRWQAQWCSDAVLSINLSVRQLISSELVPMVRSVLHETEMNPSLLQLEITETALMKDVEHARLVLRELAQLGIKLCIDDFGTGYSSLSYLKTLPIHKLKIDQSFVRDIVIDKDDAAIVIATIGLAHNLGLKVTSEGVETEAQMTFLKEHGCDEGQGYYFSRALDSSGIETFLRQFCPPFGSKCRKGW